MAFHEFNKGISSECVCTNVREAKFEPLTTEVLQLSLILDLH